MANAKFLNFIIKGYEKIMMKCIKKATTQRGN